MKRSAPYIQTEDRPEKLPRFNNKSSILASSDNSCTNRGHSHQLPSPFSSRPNSFQKISHDTKRDNDANFSIEGLTWTEEPQDPDSVYNWLQDIPPDFVDMSQPPSKRSRSRSLSSEPRGRRRSVSSDGSDSTVSKDARSSAYRAVNYVTIMETKHCYMRRSPRGPIEEDIRLCTHLLNEKSPTPDGTMFDEDCFESFHDVLQNRSEARIFVDLHHLLMPSAENQYIRGRKLLANVIDGYNDPWLKTEPIYGPKPQPDHARGLRWSTFSEAERRKLGIKPEEKSPYTAREDMYFPYLTCEIKCGNQALELADRQNMHSMCIALRALVHLSRVAGCPDRLHRRLLGFSISHELEAVRIYGYYPEIEGSRCSYFRWTIATFNVWTEESKWRSNQFVQNLDKTFLPDHINRVRDMLAQITDPEDLSFATDLDDLDEDSQISSVAASSTQGSQERIAFRRTTSSKARALQPELRTMIQILQQQLDEQRKEGESQRKEARRQAEEQKLRENKLIAQLEDQREASERQQQELRALLAQALGRRHE